MTSKTQTAHLYFSALHAPNVIIHIWWDAVSHLQGRQSEGSFFQTSALFPHLWMLCLDLKEGIPLQVLNHLPLKHILHFILLLPSHSIIMALGFLHLTSPLKLTKLLSHLLLLCSSYCEAYINTRLTFTLSWFYSGVQGSKKWKRKTYMVFLAKAGRSTQYQALFFKPAVYEELWC